MTKAATLILATLLMGGCGFAFTRSRAAPPAAIAADPSTGQVLTSVQVQSELLSFTDTFIGAASQAWNQAAGAGRTLEAGKDPAEKERGSRMRRAALENKISSVSGALAIATSPNPRVGLGDMVTMIKLQRMVIERQQAKDLYGEEIQAALVDVYKEQEDKIWRVASRAMTAQQEAEISDLIDDWRKSHPNVTYVSTVRLEDFASDRGQTVLEEEDHSPGSLLTLFALDPLAGLAPAEREVQMTRLLAERVFFYASRSPQLFKWQAESLYETMLRAPEAKQAIAAADNLAASAARVSAVAESLPRDIAAERTAAIDQVFAKLAEERHAALMELTQSLATQTKAVIDDADKAQTKLQGTLKEFRDSVQATDKAADSLTATINAADSFMARFDPDPAKPRDPNANPLADFKAAIAQTGDAADRLTALTRSMDQLLSSPALSEKATTLHNAVADAEASSKSVVDHAFWRVLILVLVAPLSIAVAVGAYRRMVKR